MTPEDKARAVLDVWLEFAIGDEVIITEACQIRSWAGLRGRITGSFVSNSQVAFSVSIFRIKGTLSLDHSVSFWPHELRHAD